MLSASSLIPSFSPSAQPWISAMGVFSSWETLERNSLRISSISFFFSMSFCSSLLAVFSSEMVFSSVSERILIFSPRTPISFFTLPSYFVSKSRHAIFSEIPASVKIGSVIFLDTNQITILPISTAVRPVQARKRFAIPTLSIMPSFGVLIIKRLPFSRNPHISMYSVWVLGSSMVRSIY